MSERSYLNWNYSGEPVDYALKTELDMDYYRARVLELCNHCLTSDRWYLSLSMTENLRYYQGNQDLSDLSYVQVLGGMKPFKKKGNVDGGLSGLVDSGGNNLPSVTGGKSCKGGMGGIANYNYAWSTVQSLMGALKERGFDLTVNAINAEAQSRRMDLRQKLLAEIAFMPVEEQLAAASGIDLAFKGEIAAGVPMPKNTEEMERFFKYSYRSETALAVETALRFEIEHLYWVQQRAECFLDLIIMSECHVRVGLSNDYLGIKRIDPRTCACDRFADGSLLRDASFFVSWSYECLSDVATEFQLDKATLNKVYERYGDNSEGFLWRGSGGNKYYAPFADAGDKGVDRVLVVRCEWIRAQNSTVGNDEDDVDDEDDVVVSLFDDDEGHKHNKGDKDKKVRKPKPISGNTVLRRHKATLVGGDILVDWGEDEHQFIEPDSMWRGRLAHVSLLPNQRDGISIGIIDLIKEQLNWINVIFNKMRIEVAKSSGRAISIDASKLPSSYGNDAVKFLLENVKGLGVNVHHGGDIGIPDNGRLIEEFDLGLSNNFSMLINTALMIIEQINGITGISKASLGILTGQNQGKAVTQMSQAASGRIVEDFFWWFYQFENEVMERMANLIKVCVAKNPDRYAAILGDVHTALLGQEADVALDSYGVFVYPYGVNTNELKGYVDASLSQGNLSPEDALGILDMANIDPRKAIRRFMELSEARRSAAAQQQQAMQEANMISQQEATAAKLELEQLKNDNLLNVAKVRAAAELQRTAMVVEGKSNDTIEKIRAEMFKILQMN